ncbi:MAG: c-type cytochrome [Campylobacteraceae bacterium]|jgi:cytochrome c553|nr:c-type cytochrome [Campylobacteraceae bacterium]
MLKRVAFSAVLLLSAFSFADDEVTIRATGDFAKELKELIEKYQRSDINGSIEVIDSSSPKSEKERLESSPIEQAMQEEIKNSEGNTNVSHETYDQYFSDEKKGGKGILDSIFNSSDEKTNIAEGKAVYDKNCSSCHGENAQKSSYPNARNLITLSKDEIELQVKSYRGDSGYGKGTGFIMRSQAIMVNDRQVRNIAEYIDYLRKSE